MIVMCSKQTGVAPLDIRCDTFVHSALHLREATPSSFHSNQESIYTYKGLLNYLFCFYIANFYDVNICSESFNSRSFFCTSSEG